MNCEIRLTNVSAEEMTRLLPLFESLAKDEGQPIQATLKAETEAPAKVKPKKAEPKKEEKPAEEEAPVAKEPEPQPEPEPVKEEEPKKTSMTEVRFALSKVKEKFGAAVVRDLLGKYNVKSFTEVPEEKYTALFEDAMTVYGKDEA